MRPGRVTSTASAGAASPSAASRAASASSIVVFEALTAAPVARRSSGGSVPSDLSSGRDDALLAAEEAVAQGLQAAGDVAVPRACVEIGADAAATSGVWAIDERRPGGTTGEAGTAPSGSARPGERGQAVAGRAALRLLGQTARTRPDG